MKRNIIYFILLTAFAAYSQKTYRLKNVEVTGRRPMKEIGIQKTTFDSIALKESITQSMADILAYNSSLFVKNYGRATLSTVSFRGTSPSHTQVTWNGMKVNNPMMGMTDFSMIPSFFVDRASLLHGTSSVTETGGSLGGLVTLETAPETVPGTTAQYIQGIGSFSTFDEFGRVARSSDKWSFSTRASYASSPNDYKYVNHDKKENIYDSDHLIIGQYYPTERNRSGAFRDLNILQEIYFNSLRGDKASLCVWYLNSNRELPMLTTDYGDEKSFENRQRERTLRGVLSWNHIRSKWKTGVSAGVSHTWSAYDYRREITDGNWASMTRSRSNTTTLYAALDGEFAPLRNLLLTAALNADQYFVRSIDKKIVLQEGGEGLVGYDKARVAFSGMVSAKWQIHPRAGASVVLRGESLGDKVAPLIPAFFFDAVLSPAGMITLKGSVSRNYRFPSLNDLYFMPGGNPDLKNESGFTYDTGLSFNISRNSRYTLGGEVTWFDSRISNWILWLPTNRGFFSPSNVKKVHSYGIETKLSGEIELPRKWKAAADATLSWTPSINCGEPVSEADRSVGKQLPYVPKLSAALTGRLAWRNWEFAYKWLYYSKRYTKSSNDLTISGYLPDYYMNNISLEKNWNLKQSLRLSFKFAVNNLFNEHYLSVLSHPMPGINFTGTIGIRFHSR